jgi:hypothetical protein
LHCKSDFHLPFCCTCPSFSEIMATLAKIGCFDAANHPLLEDTNRPTHKGFLDELLKFDKSVRHISMLVLHNYIISYCPILLKMLGELFYIQNSKPKLEMNRKKYLTEDHTFFGGVWGHGEGPGHVGVALWC